MLDRCQEVESARASVTNRSQRGPRRLEMWLRGLATNIICSFGVPRRDVSSAGLDPSVSSLYNVARTQTELDPIAKRNVQDGGSSLLSIGLHRAVSSPSTPSSTSPCWRGCAANVRGTTKPKNASAQSG
jgi:hypothetical protein